MLSRQAKLDLSLSDVINQPNNELVIRNVKLFYRTIFRSKRIDMSNQKLIFSIFLSLVTISIGCTSRNNQVTIKNEQGQILEQYEISTKDSLKNGNYLLFAEDGDTIVWAQYSNGALNGERRVYFENGNPQVIEHYQNGIHQGLYQAFFEDGKVELQGRYANGSMEGEWRGFYKNGQLKEVVQFKENNENGAFTEYHPNGKLKAKGAYLDGDNEHGLLELYNENGVLERKMDCNQGRCYTIWKLESI